MDKSSYFHRWFGTVHTDAEVTGSRTDPRPLNELAALRQALLDAVAPCTERHRLRATGQIERAASAMELWLLRADIFQYLAQDVGEMQAAQRIARLLPCFEGLVPAVTARHHAAGNRGHAANLR